MKVLLEIAAFNIESAQIAAKAGADRIELCSDYTAGGLTPPDEIIMQARASLSCAFFVMIRPRPGDFVYAVAEQARMKEDLLRARALGADGFVFGILDENGRIDEAANKELVTLAHPLPCTFHRAFDDLDNKAAGLETLIDCGFQRVLTSGGQGNAIDYAETLEQMILQANGRIIVLPGGGVRTNNIEVLREITGAREFHSAAITMQGDQVDPVAVQEMKRVLQED